MWLKVRNRLINLDNVNEIYFYDLLDHGSYFVKYIYMGEEKKRDLVELSNRENAKEVFEAISKLIDKKNGVSDLIEIVKNGGINEVQ